MAHPQDSRRRRTVATIPVQLERLLAPPLDVLAEAINGNADVDQLLEEATAWRRAIRAQELDGSALAEAIARILEAAECATDLLMDDPAVLCFAWTGPRVATRLLWIVEYCATGREPWPLGSLEALLPAQRSRYVAAEGRRLLDWNGAQGAERERLRPYFKFEAEQESGQPAKWKGKSYGDGALWPGGIEDFLDDLWTTLERCCAASGTHYGHNPVSNLFRERMRGRPAAKTMYRWLRGAGLRPSDIASGKVVRGNYREFVAT